MNLNFNSKWSMFKWAIAHMFKTKHGSELKSIKQIQQQEDGTIDYNITGIKTRHAYARKYRQIHHFFKSRVVEPAILMFDVFFSHLKIKDEQIPNEPHNYLLLAHKQAWDISQRDYYKHFIKNGQTFNMTSKEIDDGMLKDETLQLYKSLNEWIMTVAVMDTAHRERLNMYLINLYLILQKEFSKNDTIAHLIYHEKNVNDKEYFQIFTKVRQHMIRQVEKHNPEEK